MIIQIYEIASAEDARAACELGVDHIGVLVGEGIFPREQSIAMARNIFVAVGSKAKCSALSLSSDLDHIRRIARELAPDILHLGCAPEMLGPSHIQQLKHEFSGIMLMRSIPVVDESSIALASSYDGVADILLLDSYSAGDKQVGAVGRTHDWELDRRIVEGVKVPVIIAGGLALHNVAAAIQASHPAGVDSKTETDRGDGSHRKDLAKVRAFVEAVRRTH